MAIWPASPCVVHRGRRWIHRQTATSMNKRLGQHQLGRRDALLARPTGRQRGRRCVHSVRVVGPVLYAVLSTHAVNSLAPLTKPLEMKPLEDCHK